MTGSAQAGSPRLGAEPAGLGRGRMSARVTEGAWSHLPLPTAHLKTSAGSWCPFWKMSA